jgi:integrase
MAGNLFKVTVVQHWVYDCWVGVDGQPCCEGTPGARFVQARKVKAGTPGAKKVKKKSGKWYGRLPGSTKPVPLSTNKVAAQQILAGLIRKSELGRAGIADPFEEHRKRPLAEHLSDWGAALEARGNTGKHVQMKLSRAGRIVATCKFAFIGDLSASRVEAALSDMRREPRFGTQTSNHYLAAIKQFARWLMKDRRTAENPLTHLEGGNVKLDRRHERRELSDAELAYLFEHTSHSGCRCKFAGADREMLYLVSVYTGLRATELASPMPESFALDRSPATVTVATAYSKHRREDVVPLHVDLIRRLRPWLASKPPGLRVWPGRWAKNCLGGKMLRADLLAARSA